MRGTSPLADRRRRCCRQINGLQVAQDTFAKPGLAAIIALTVRPTVRCLRGDGLNARLAIPSGLRSCTCSTMPPSTRQRANRRPAFTDVAQGWRGRRRLPTTWPPRSHCAKVSRSRFIDAASVRRPARTAPRTFKTPSIVQFRPAGSRSIPAGGHVPRQSGFEGSSRPRTSSRYDPCATGGLISLMRKSTT